MGSIPSSAMSSPPPRGPYQHGLVYSRATDRGQALPCCLERYLVGPVDEPDFTNWETEFAYLILDD